MSKPVEDYLWAESASAGDVTDPAGIRSPGFAVDTTVEYDEFNYLFRALGRWIDYLKDGNGGLHASFTDALSVGSLEDGEIIVVSPPTDIDTGDELTLWSATQNYDLGSGADLDLCATNGSHFAAVNNTSNVVYVWNDNDDSVTTISGASTTGSTIRDIAITKDAIGLAAADIFDVYELDGTLVGSVAPGSAPGFQCVCAATTKFFAGSSDDLVQIDYDIGAGTVTDTTLYDHLAEVTAVCTDGARVFGGGASNGSSEVAFAWDIAGGATIWTSSTGSLNEPTGMATDGDRLYVTKAATGTEVREAYDGTLLAGFSASGNDIAVDAERVYLFGINTTATWSFYRKVDMFEDTAGEVSADLFEPNSDSIEDWTGLPTAGCASGTQVLGVGASDGSFNAWTLCSIKDPRKFVYRSAEGAITNGMAPFHPID